MSGRSRRILGPECVAEGAAWLAAHDPAMARIIAPLGPLPLRLRPQGFAELLSGIVSQQVSTASAAAIWARVVAAGMDRAETVCAAPDESLRALGLSRPKVRYARALAEAGLDYGALDAMDDAAVLATLTAVPGIGRWTAEIYAMFSLGRADVFAHGDLALQEAARAALSLDARPDARAMAILAARWSPWRAVAARALWAHYRILTRREGVR